MTGMVQPIGSSDAPTPNGHYSQAVRAGGFIFVSTQLPIVAGAEPAIAPGIEQQAGQVVDNIAAILHAAHVSLAHVVSVTIFVTDMDSWPSVDRLFAAKFGTHRPARGVVMSPRLHLGALVAMQAIAVDAVPPRPITAGRR